MKAFSVIIPNLNSVIIDKTIKALENQNIGYQYYEVIIVGKDVHGLVCESELVKFYRTDVPLPAGEARNRGAMQAEGDILVFIDADCIPLPNLLERYMERFTDPNVTVVGGGVAIETKNYWTLADNLSVFHEYLSIRPPGLRHLLPSLNLAIRRTAFQDIGGFDPQRLAGEDADLTTRLRKRGFSLYFEPQAVVWHTPIRNRLIDLIMHSYHQGMYSIKVDHRHSPEDRLPWPLDTRWGLILFAPLLAGAISIKIIVTNLKLIRYWYTLPAIYVSKLAWCYGASNHPKWSS